MEKSELLRALQTEIHRHSFDAFVDEPPVIVESGHGEVILGCPACRKRINSLAQFVDHIADDVLPALFERLG